MTEDELEEAVFLDEALDLESEIYEPHPAIEDAAFEGDFRIPGELYNDLFDYQKTCMWNICSYNSWLVKFRLNCSV
jgi:DNA excision repair protein ERCC-6